MGCPDCACSSPPATAESVLRKIAREAESWEDGIFFADYVPLSSDEVALVYSLMDEVAGEELETFPDPTEFFPGEPEVDWPTLTAALAAVGRVFVRGALVGAGIASLIWWLA